MGNLVSRKPTFNLSTDLVDLKGKVIIVTGGKWVLVYLSSYKDDMKLDTVRELGFQRFNTLHALEQRFTLQREMNLVLLELLQDWSMRGLNRVMEKLSG